MIYLNGKGIWKWFNWESNDIISTSLQERKLFPKGKDDQGISSELKNMRSRKYVAIATQWTMKELQGNKGHFCLQVYQKLREATHLVNVLSILSRYYLKLKMTVWNGVFLYRKKEKQPFCRNLMHWESITAFSSQNLNIKQHTFVINILFKGMIICVVHRS